MTARDKAFAALHAISGAKYLPLEALEKRLRHFGFAEQWVSDTAREWYREFGLGRVVDEEGPLFAPASLCCCGHDGKMHQEPILGLTEVHECLVVGCPCPDFRRAPEEEPPVLCYCGAALPGSEHGDFCSQACRTQALEESR